MSTPLTLAQIAQNALNYLLGIAGILCVVMLVVGGIFYMTSGGDEDRMEIGKKTITYAIIGLAVILLSLAIVSAIAGVISGT
jgi:hypothetical protein